MTDAVSNHIGEEIAISIRPLSEYVPLRLLLRFAFTTAPSTTAGADLLEALVRELSVLFSKADRFGVTVIEGEMIGDLSRKTDGEGIWMSMRRERGPEAWIETTDCIEETIEIDEDMA